MLVTPVGVNKDDRGWRRDVGEGLTCVGDNGYEQPPRRFSLRHHEPLQAGDVENGEGDPHHEQCEQADQASDRLGEDHFAAGAGALGWARQPFVEDLVKAVEHAAHADDDVANGSIPQILVFHRFATLRFGGGTAGGRRAGISIRHDEDSPDGHQDGKNLVEPEFLLQQRYTKYVCEESRAIVNGG